MGPDSKDDQKSAPPQGGDVSHNPHHNGPMPADHKAELEKHDVCVSPGHTNHGAGHH